MRKFCLLLLAALFGGYVGTAGVAAGPVVMTDTSGVSAPTAADERVEWTVLVPELYNNLYLAGSILDLDHDKGIVRLRTDVQGDIDVQFKPAALAPLQVGDVAVIYLGFSIAERTISAESCDLLAVKVAAC